MNALRIMVFRVGEELPRVNHDLSKESSSWGRGAEADDQCVPWPFLRSPA
jgi:hypothetical protein